MRSGWLVVVVAVVVAVEKDWDKSRSCPTCSTYGRVINDLKQKIGNKSYVNIL